MERKSRVRISSGTTTRETQNRHFECACALYMQYKWCYVATRDVSSKDFSTRADLIVLT